MLTQLKWLFRTLDFVVFIMRSHRGHGQFHLLSLGSFSGHKTHAHPQQWAAWCWSHRSRNDDDQLINAIVCWRTWCLSGSFTRTHVCHREIFIRVFLWIWGSWSLSDSRLLKIHLTATLNYHTGNQTRLETQRKAWMCTRAHISVS